MSRLNCVWRSEDSLGLVRLIPRRMEMLACCSGRAPVSVLYRPSRRLGRMAVSLSRFVGLRTHDGPQARELRAVLGDFGYDAEHVACMRSEGRDQWVVAMTGGACESELVKVGAGRQSLSVEDEGRLLRMLSGRVGSFRVPCSHRVISGDGWSAFDMERVVGQPDIPAFSPEVAHEACVALSREAGGVTHGDLTPWNMMCVGSGRWILDWERSRAYLPGYDLAYYYLSSAYVAAFLGRGEAVALLMGEDGGGVRLAVALGVLPSELGEGVKEAAEYFLRKNPSDPLLHRLVRECESGAGGYGWCAWAV